MHRHPYRSYADDIRIEISSADLSRVLTMGRLVKYAGVWTLAALISFIAVEIGYRILLVIENPFLRPTSSNESTAVNAFTRSFWRFDAVRGYDLVSRENIYSVAFQNGKILGCGLVPQLNKYGGPGPAEGSYEGAQVKIAVFGNSFNLNTNDDNLTWLHYLQRELTKRLHKSVFVLNRARDGMGLMQMFDVAADETPKYKPDLVLIASATERAPRQWRTETVIDGEERVLTMLSPIPEPTTVPPGAYDTFLIHHGITKEWCEAHKNGSLYDQVAKEVISRYQHTRLHSFQRILAFNRSFLWNRLVYKNAFQGLFLSNPPLSGSDYASDRQLADTIKALKQTGIPYLVVHLPVAPEVKSEKEYNWDPPAEEIAHVVSRLTGQPVYGLLDYMPLPVENPEKMAVTETDLHPSKFGMILYANAVTNLILKSGLYRAPTAAR
jgi:hypothetical protein